MRINALYEHNVLWFRAGRRGLHNMARPRKYSDELRRRAIDEVVERDCRIPDVARDLGIGSPETLRGWVRQAEGDRGLKSGLTAATQARERLERGHSDRTREVLGLLGPDVEEVPVGPLTVGAVEQVARRLDVREVDALELHEPTGGHAQFVVEVLRLAAAGSGSVSSTSLPTWLTSGSVTPCVGRPTLAPEQTVERPAR